MTGAVALVDRQIHPLLDSARSSAIRSGPDEVRGCEGP